MVCLVCGDRTEMRDHRLVASVAVQPRMFFERRPYTRPELSVAEKTIDERRRPTRRGVAFEVHRESLAVGPAVIGLMATDARHGLRPRPPLVPEELLAERDFLRRHRIVCRHEGRVGIEAKR